jgi:hypothetical protein
VLQTGFLQSSGSCSSPQPVAQHDTINRGLHALCSVSIRSFDGMASRALPCAGRNMCFITNARIVARRCALVLKPDKLMYWAISEQRTVRRHAARRLLMATELRLPDLKPLRNETCRFNQLRTCSMSAEYAGWDLVPAHRERFSRITESFVVGISCRRRGLNSALNSASE